VYQTSYSGSVPSQDWIDSNFVATNTVGKHTVSADDLMKWTARSSSYGFTVYRLQ
jgi:hypothetical protein